METEIVDREEFRASFPAISPRFPIEVYSAGRMAEIYWNRLHFGSMPEVQSKIDEFRVPSPTNFYWREVMRAIRLKVKEVNERRRLSGNA